MTERRRPSRPETSRRGADEGGCVGHRACPRKEDKRLVQGEGVFVDDVKRHGMGYVHFVRSPYAHAQITLDRRLEGARGSTGVYGTLTGDEVAIAHRPVLPDRVSPGGTSRTTRSRSARCATSASRSSAVVATTRELARDAPELVEVEYEPLAVVIDARARARRRTRRSCTTTPATNLMWQGVYEWGDSTRAFAEADHGRQDRRAALPPLQLDAARVRRCARRVQPRHGPVDDVTANNQFPGFARDHDGARDARRLDKLRFVTQDIGGGFGNKITSHPQLVACCCLLARKLNRPVQWTEWRTDFHMSMSHGNERWFHDTEVAGQDRRHAARLPHEGARRRRRVAALRAARRRHLGAGDARRVPAGATSASSSRRSRRTRRPCSPNRGYSRMQHLWFTERVIDIVAHELELDPVEVRKRNYITRRGHAVRDAERLRLRLRRLRARCSTSRSS